MKPLPHKPKLLNLAIAGLVMSGAPLTDAFAQEWVWDGNGGDDSWFYSYYDNSPLTNWQDNTSGPFILPADGDSLTFADNARLTPLNDGPAGLVVNGLRFDSTAGQFTLNGSAITSTSNITNNSNNLQTINMPITVGSDQTWDGGTKGLKVNGAVTLGNFGLTLSNQTAIDNHTIDFVVGDTGSATLTLQSDSSFSNLNSILGNNNGSTGTATVNGAKSFWANSGALTLGNLGTGTLNIQNGGMVSNSSGILGNASQSYDHNRPRILTFNGTGIATVTGANSLWANSGDLSVGNLSNGTLNIQNGGKVSDSNGFLGNGSKGNLAFGSALLGNGTATVDGASSLWDNTGDLNVGYLGTGALHIQNGGKVSDNNGVLGNGSEFNVGYLYTTIQGNGTATVDGASSLWDNTGDLNVGYLGTGILHIQNGGKVSDSNGFLGNGSQFTDLMGKSIAINGSGTATVDGANSLWDNTGDLNVGYLGTGALKIQNGGNVRDSSGFIGNRSGSTGTATVDGANSLWDNTGDLNVGYLGSGTLNISNGGSVTVGKALNIASQGIINLEGGRLSFNTASYSNAGQFNWSSGVLTLVDANGVTLGSNDFTPAITNLSSGKTLDVKNTLTVNTDNFLLLSGGQVKAGTLALNGGIVAGTALDAGGIGTLKGYGTVASAITDGTASNTFQASGGTLTIGNANTANGFDFGGQLIVGSHRVVLLDQDQAQLGFRTTLGDGGQLEAGKGMVLGNNEALSYSGNASILGDFTNNGAVSGSSGTLTFLNDVKGAGSFAGDIAFHAAYNPGNSPAAIDFNGGNATYDSSSVLTIEIFGNSPGSEYDQLLNIDHLNFNGTLALVFGNHFTPTAGSHFNLFGFNQFSGSFAPDRITVTGLDRSLLDFSSLASNGRLQVAAVPLPSAAWLFLSGLTGFWARSRRSIANPA